MSLSDQSIAEDVNIQFEQFVNKKTFDAIFYQKPETDRLDKNKIQEHVMKELLTKFTEEELQMALPRIRQCSIPLLVKETHMKAPRRVSPATLAKWTCL